MIFLNYQSAIANHQSNKFIQKTNSKAATMSTPQEFLAKSNQGYAKFRQHITLIACGFFTAIFTATSGLAAERIVFTYEPLGKFPLEVNALETYVRDGKVTPELETYAKLLGQEQLAQLRELLQTRFTIDSTAVTNFAKSPVGEALLRRMGTIFETGTGTNGGRALQSALIAAASDRRGLTILRIIDEFPSQTLQVDLNQGLKMLGDLSDVLRRGSEIVAVIEQQAATEAKKTETNFAQKPDLRQPGAFKWQQLPLTLTDSSRDRTLPVIVYLPENSNPKPAPVIVISHGAGEDINTFTYLAQHLASYGFGVIVLEHPGSNAKRFEQFLAGTSPPPESTEWLDRPLDIKYILDELTRRAQSEPNFQKLNFQQVGVLGHSLGGYTALALAGASPDLERLRFDCRNEDTLNLSMLVQCRAVEIPLNTDLSLLADDRIKAVMPINPVSSSILGKSGLKKVQIPVMIFAASQDIFTPAVSEQIRPFTWLTTPNKYLVLIENATHFSAIAGPISGLGVIPIAPEMIGPNPQLAQTYIKGLSVAFFEKYLNNKSDFKPYLSAAYAQFISQTPLDLSLVESLTIPSRQGQKTFSSIK
jgi:predicted dienelactone hydrolase